MKNVFKMFKKRVKFKFFNGFLTLWVIIWYQFNKHWWTIFLPFWPSVQQSSLQIKWGLLPLECHSDKRHVDISDWILFQSKLRWSGHVLLLEFYSRGPEMMVKPIKELLDVFLLQIVWNCFRNEQKTDKRQKTKHVEPFQFIWGPS